MSAHRKGSSLIELLVLITVIAVLIALLLPTVQQTREDVYQTQGRTNLKQFGLAVGSAGVVSHDISPALGLGFRSTSGSVNLSEL